MSSYQLDLFSSLGINILLALSVYCPMATGQLSIGNAGFMAIGAYVSAMLTVHVHLPLFPSLIIGGIAAAIIGVLFGFPALRLKGIFLAMATLCFGEIVRNFFMNFLQPLTGGAYGFRGIGDVPVSISWIWGWVVLSLVFFFFLSRSRVGLALTATHDDETVSELIGINIVFLKVAAFGVGAFIAGVAGGLYAHYYLYIEPEFFNVWESIFIALYVIMGGMLTYWGPVLGASIFTLLPEFLRFLQDWRGAFFGVVIIGLMIARPSGLVTREILRIDFWIPYLKRRKP
ncbi:MAG: branched-chain amino acid ABC transporter permease [Desulfobacteraceae bacterium]|jgi:branched-chain amino acid transport system permease protein|nr:branched-chain amino acid ABC transporter permease [Desulfobacteraceae bacterium]